jgi:hypothetical protein
VSWQKKQRYGIVGENAEHDQAFVLLGRIEGDFLPNIVFMEPRSAVNFGKEWWIFLQSASPDNFYFPREQSDERPGSLLLDPSGPIAIAVRNEHGRVGYFGLENFVVGAKRPNYYAAVTNWCIQVGGNLDPHAVVEVQALPPG